MLYGRALPSNLCFSICYFSSIGSLWSLSPVAHPVFSAAPSACFVCIGGCPSPLRRSHSIFIVSHAILLTVYYRYYILPSQPCRGRTCVAFTLAPLFQTLLFPFSPLSSPAPTSTRRPQFSLALLPQPSAVKRNYYRATELCYSYGRGTAG